MRAKSVAEFQKIVWQFYRDHGRHALPWRHTTDPYRILVSELMLQQTQVDRVVPKYDAFIEKWPTTKSLADASLGEVLKAWQGLGYNRRAKFLHQAAVYVETELSGVFPKTETDLRCLPGVGPYTAAAVAAFAYDARVTLIETNVRQVIIFHFLQDREDITDKEILELVQKTLPRADFRSWYAALMDYGAYLKKEHGNLTRRSSSYTKQSPFKGSDREIRGAILRVLSGNPLTKNKLYKELQFDSDRIEAQLTSLEKEGLVIRNKTKFLLPI